MTASGRGRVLALRHIPSGGLGRIGKALRTRTLDIDELSLVEHPNLSVNLSSYRGLLILGGPMSANDEFEWLVQELYLIERALREKIPLMGICLGAQMLAKVLGSKVTKAAEKEIGWGEIRPTEHARSDELFRGLRDFTTVFQWHYESYKLPRDAVRLARSERCLEQAYRWGDRVYGMQFHLEAGPDEISRWQEEDRACGAAREIEREVDPWRADRELAALAEQVFGGWLDMVNAA